MRTPLRIGHSLIAAALLSGAAASVAAQPAGHVTVDFPVQTTSASGTPSDTVGIVSGSGSIEHWFSKDRGRVFYELSMDRFRTAEAFDTWLHNAGAVGNFAVRGSTVNVGGALFWRENSGGWSDAGFRGVNLQSSIERSLPKGTLTAAYNFYARSFPDAQALNQVEHYGHVRGVVNLPTRTTFVGVAGAGWKRYDGDVTEMLATAPLPEAGMRGRGRGALLLGSMSSYRLLNEPVARTLWMWSARAAQSLDDRTGIWVEHEQRRANGDAPPALVWTPPLYYDDGVYDDPYVVETRTWRAGVRHVFAAGHQLGASVDRAVRRFDGLDIVNEEGISGGQRSDTLLRNGVDTEITVRSSGAFDVVLLASYGYVRNTSNDRAETYRSHIGSLGLSFRF